MTTPVQKTGDEIFLGKLGEILPSLVSAGILPLATTHLGFLLLPAAQMTSFCTLQLYLQKLLKLFVLFAFSNTLRKAFGS